MINRWYEITQELNGVGDVTAAFELFLTDRFQEQIINNLAQQNGIPTDGTYNNALAHAARKRQYLLSPNALLTRINFHF